MSSGTNTTISHSLRLTMNSAVVVTMYARVISEQPNFKNIQGIPNLSQHISNCKAHSETWISDIIPAIIGIITDIIQFGMSFREVHYETTEYIEMLKEGDESAKEKIEFILQDILISDMDEKVNNVREVINKIQEFYQDYLGDLHSFQSDSGKADEAMTKDNEDILTTSQDLKDSQDSVREYETELEDLVYALIATVGTSILVPVFGITIGGLASIGEGIAYAVLKSEYSDAIDKVSKDTIRLGNLNSELTLLKTIKSQLVSMESNLQTVLVKIADVKDAWVGLKNSSSDTLEMIKKAPPSRINKTELEAIADTVKIRMDEAKDHWEGTLEYAEQIMPSGEEILNVQARSVEELIDIIKNGVTPTTDVDPIVG